MNFGNEFLEILIRIILPIFREEVVKEDVDNDACEAFALGSKKSLCFEENGMAICEVVHSPVEHNSFDEVGGEFCAEAFRSASYEIAQERPHTRSISGAGEMKVSEEVQSLFDRYPVLSMLSMIVWQNGRLLPEEEVRLSPFDPGLTVGQGIFETMLAIQGHVLQWERHKRRFESSAKILGLHMPDLTEVESAMNEVVCANPTCRCRARVRVTLTGGGNLLVTAKPVSEASLKTTAVVLDLPIHEQSFHAGLKTLSYADNLAALAEAKAQGAEEGIRANTRGELCEGCVSNIFFVKKGQIHTPALETGCLPGVMRGLILERNPTVKVGVWPLAVIEEADEIWLTNSLKGVQGVKRLGEREMMAESVLAKQVRSSVAGG